MTRQEYIDGIAEAYSVVKLLSCKNGCKVIRLRNKKLGKDMVLHSLPKGTEIYDFLLNIGCENLPLIYDVIKCDDGQIVLEEFIEGITVTQVLESGKYKYNGIKKVIGGVCNALNVMHGNGFIHRDVKPDNIIIGNNGRVVLIDFNTVRKAENIKDTVVMGTVGYASPEQLGVAECDARSDIYAIGVLINVMATGLHPSQKLAKGKIGKVVKKCTDINPDNRFNSVSALLKDL